MSNTLIDPTELRTKEQTAQRLHITGRTLQKLVARGEITPTYIVPGRPMFTEGEIQRFIAAKTEIRHEVPQFVGTLAQA